MMIDREDWWLWTILLAVFAAFFFILGVSITSEIWRRELINKNIGRWTVDPNTGITTFEIGNKP